jgi:protein SCO1/2
VEINELARSMKASSKFKKFAGLIFILSLPAIFLSIFSSGKHKFATRPFYGPKETKVVVDEYGVETIDTIYHTIPSFAFANQNGEIVTNADYDGKIYVADFFFTRCPTICPKMTANMVRLQWKLKDDAFADIKFLSHTIDPRHDSVEVLKSYAQDAGADENRWNFVTGSQEEIYEVGQQGYFLSAMEDSLAPGGYLHSGLFVLIDRERHIRGIYDGTTSDEVDKLFDDVKMLFKEEKILAKEAREKAENGK